MCLQKKFQLKLLPDSIKCRHILLGTIDPQTQQPICLTALLTRLADSIAAAIKGGANFDSLEAKYSTDQAAIKTNGVMTFDLANHSGRKFCKRIR